MIILTLRTDKVDSEIGLYENDTQLAYETWSAHRQLAETIHQKIEALLKNCHKDWQDIEGIVMYEGPGSFTGLRIGLSVGNALSYSRNIPAIGANGDDWQRGGITALQGGQGKKTPVMPVYGSEAHITQPK